jgi:hypothetical protein
VLPPLGPMPTVMTSPLPTEVLTVVASVIELTLTVSSPNAVLMRIEFTLSSEMVTIPLSVRWAPASMAA